MCKRWILSSRTEKPPKKIKDRRENGLHSTYLIKKKLQCYYIAKSMSCAHSSRMHHNQSNNHLYSTIIPINRILTMILLYI